jgi:hypothetical protein
MRGHVTPRRTGRNGTMRWQERRENERVSREHQEFLEALAVVARKLNSAEQANDEQAYMQIHDTEWLPTYLNCKRSIGGELASAVVRDASVLARVS